MPDNKPKWTPGPWCYIPGPGYQYVVELDREGRILLVASGVPTGREAEIRANLTLASAAPDLYTALEALLTKVGLWADLECHTPPELCIEAAEAMARAALLKANPQRI